jgi:hypothetical protein
MMTNVARTHARTEQAASAGVSGQVVTCTALAGRVTLESYLSAGRGAAMGEWLRTTLFTGIGVAIVIFMVIGILGAVLLVVARDPDRCCGYPGGFPGPVTTGKAP